jgi:hypothetical protein
LVIAACSLDCGSNRETNNHNTNGYQNKESLPAEGTPFTSFGGIPLRAVLFLSAACKQKLGCFLRQKTEFFQKYLQSYSFACCYIIKPVYLHEKRMKIVGKLGFCTYVTRFCYLINILAGLYTDSNFSRLKTMLSIRPMKQPRLT